MNINSLLVLAGRSDSKKLNNKSMAKYEKWGYEKAPGNITLDVHRGITNIITRKSEEGYNVAVAVVPSDSLERGAIMSAAPELLDFAEQFKSVVGALILAVDRIEEESVKESSSHILASLSMLSEAAIKKAKGGEDEH